MHVKMWVPTGLYAVGEFKWTLFRCRYAGKAARASSGIPSYRVANPRPMKEVDGGVLEDESSRRPHSTS